MKDPKIQTMNLSNCAAQPARPHIAKTETPPVGERLRALRRMKDLSLQQLAKQAGLAYTTAQGAEQRGADPHLSTLFKLCNALDIEPADLLDTERFKTSLIRFVEGK